MSCNFFYTCALFVTLSFQTIFAQSFTNIHSREYTYIHRQSPSSQINANLNENDDKFDKNEEKNDLYVSQSNNHPPRVIADVDSVSVDFNDRLFYSFLLEDHFEDEDREV